jgi:hypothetical protein
MSDGGSARNLRLPSSFAMSAACRYFSFRMRVTDLSGILHELAVLGAVI